MWLEMLIQTRGKDLLRIKGILNLQGQSRPVAIHAVQHVLHPPALLAAWPEGDPRSSRIVFITQDLPRDIVAFLIQDAAAVSAPFLAASPLIAEDDLVSRTVLSRRVMAR